MIGEPYLKNKVFSWHPLKKSSFFSDSENLKGVFLLKKIGIQFMTRTALIAAAYAALTYAFAWMSYEQLQFRVAEILVLFAFIEPRYGLGLILGCVLANMASPLGIIDVVAGSFATFAAIAFIVTVRKKLGCSKKALVIASLGPVISNALIVGLELTYVFNTPFLWNAFYVAVGEVVVVTIAGTVVVNSIISNNKLTEKLYID